MSRSGGMVVLVKDEFFNDVKVKNMVQVKMLYGFLLEMCFFQELVLFGLCTPT